MFRASGCGSFLFGARVGLIGLAQLLAFLALVRCGVLSCAALCCVVLCCAVLRSSALCCAGCGRFDVWQPSLHTRRMIGVLVDDGFLCRDPTCLGALEWEDLTDNVSAFVKPKNDVKCSFIIDMRNLNDCSKVPLRNVKLPSIHTVFRTIQREIHRGAPLWGITLDISNFYWSLQIPAEHRGLFRIQGAHFHCLPFGWKFSPVLAQDTLAALL